MGFQRNVANGLFSLLAGIIKYYFEINIVPFLELQNKMPLKNTLG